MNSVASDKRRYDMRRSSLARTSLVRNREAGEPLRPAEPIQCGTCCDMPWRRMGVCKECRLPYQAERIER